MNSKEYLEEMKQYFKVSSVEDVAEKLGYKRATASTWRSRGISKGVKLKFESIKSNDYILNKHNQALEVNNRDLIKLDSSIYSVPALVIKASAGEGNHLESIDSFDTWGTINMDKLLFKSISPEKLRAIQVDGYSMAPMLMPDSWVVFEFDRGFEGDGLYIINWRNILMVKKIQLDMGNGLLQIVSVNPDYDSYEVNPDDQSIFKIIGRVVRTII